MKFSSILLAAGSSERFGRNKLLLPLRDKTVLETAVDNFLIPELAELLLVTGAFHAEMIRMKFPEVVRIVYNPRFDLGMSESIRIGLTHASASSDGIFITPADVPLIKQETLHRMIEKFTKGNIVIPTHQNKKGHPVLISREIARSCVRNSSEKILYDTIKAHRDRVELVETHDPGILMDMDTSEDYENLKKSM